MAHAGDTVIVMNGTYDNEGQVADPSSLGAVVPVYNAGTASAPITIMAQNRGQAILNAASSTQSSMGCWGAWAYFDVSHTSYVVIQGFVIENGCIQGIHANGPAHDITIRWNEIKNIGNWNSPVANSSPSGIYITPTQYNFTFDGNIFHDIGGGTAVNQEHAIYSSASNVTIVNNVFYNQVHGFDVTLAGGSNIYISNNTFAFPNPSRGGHICIWDDDILNSLQNIVIQNNVFYKPNSYAIGTSLVGGLIGGCNISNNLTTVGSIFDYGSTCSMANNIVNTDPKLANTTSAPFDFHLLSGSPAIDNGINISNTVVDLDNWPRPVNGVYDRGAYEYHSTPTITLTANPPSISVAQGSGVTDLITATVTGSASPSFTVSGLPSGVTASFSPSSCGGSCSTTLTINASGSYQGTASLTVKGTNGTVTGSTTISLTVTPQSITQQQPINGDYTSGLAGEWKLLGNANDSVYADNGSIHSGVSWLTGTIAGLGLSLLGLNGTTGYISINDASQLDMTTNLTVAFWVYAVPSPTGDPGQRVVAKLYDWDIKLNNTSPQFSGAGRYAMTDYSLPSYTWTHVAFTYASGTVSAYINGKAVGMAANTFTAGTTLPSYQYGVYIGADSSLIDFFSGQLSDVRLYNRALGAADVASLYSAGTSAFK